jgi:IS30 family transposase
VAGALTIASTAQWHADLRARRPISHGLRLEFPDDQSMHVSHEAIYQSLYVQGSGALRRELTACLRTGRALRVPRARAHSRGKGLITQEVMISERLAEVEDRAVPGHWEGDLILGLGSSAIGTLVERSSRFTMLLYLPPMDGHRGSRTVPRSLGTARRTGALVTRFSGGGR